MAEIKFEDNSDEVEETDQYIDETIQALTASHCILDANNKHQQKQPQNNGQEEEETTPSTPKKRVPKNKSKFHETMWQSKFSLIKNEMHEQVSEDDMAWLASLPENELDMLISYKNIALERAAFVQDENVNRIFSFRALRAMGELLKEFVNENLKKVQFLAKATETKNIPLEKKGEIHSLEGGEYNGIEPIVETEFDDVTTLETRNVLLEENEGRLPSERVQEYNNIELIVQEELEEMTATNNLKRKRDFSCEQEEMCLKKQKMILNGRPN